MHIEPVVRCANRLGESPVWSVREQKLYWVDSRAPAVLRYDPATGSTELRSLPEVVGSIGLRRRGGLVVAMATGLHFLDFDAGSLTFVVDPEADLPENRFNDGRCDRQGRFWSGTMNDTRRDPTGSLYRFDPDGRATRIRGDLIVPNSISWSPDDRVMYLADTYRTRIMSCAFSAEKGELGEPQLFVDASNHPGRPDGSTVDAEGFLWNAEFGGGRIVRYAPDGRIDRVLELPVGQPSSCSFGGRRLEVLYITTATQRMSEDALRAEPLAGALLAVEVGVQGLPEPEFAG